MEPRIQYAKTDDGARIAFATLGSGPPLVLAHHMDVVPAVASDWFVVRSAASSVTASSGDAAHSI